ncbi:MAG: ABC transporter permease [Spirochaetia bacterium]
MRGTTKLGRTLGKNTLQMSIMALPAMITLFIFNYIPMAGIIIAFKRFRVNLGIFKSPWVGFENFDFFFSSQYAWRITRNTLGYNTVFIFLGLVLSVFIALVLYEVTNRGMIKIYQTIFLVPYFLSWVVVSYVLLAFLSTRYGILNNWFEALGSDGRQWYVEAKHWPAILTSMYLWKHVGYFSIIYYAGLMGIDRELFESAAIDGASKVQTIRHISIPLLSNLMVILVLLQVGKIFYADFGLFYQLPRQIGSLFSTTDVIDTYVYRALRVTGDIGLAGAVNFYQAMVGFILVLVSNLIVGKISKEHALF